MDELSCPGDEVDRRVMYPILVVDDGEPIRLGWCESSAAFLRMVNDFNDAQLQSLLICDASGRSLVARRAESIADSSFVFDSEGGVKTARIVKVLMRHTSQLRLKLGSSPSQRPIQLATQIVEAQLSRIRRSRFVPIIVLIISTILGGALALPFKGAASSIGLAVIVGGFVGGIFCAFRVLNIRCPSCSRQFYVRGHLFGYTNTLTRSCLHCGLSSHWKSGNSMNGDWL